MTLVLSVSTILHGPAGGIGLSTRLLRMFATPPTATLRALCSACVDARLPSVRVPRADATAVPPPTTSWGPPELTGRPHRRYGYQGSPHLPPRPVAASAPRPQHRRVWIPLACIGLVLVLAAVGGIIALAGRLGADQTFTDADQVVAVHLPRRWADETAWNGGELDGESYVANLELFDDSYGQRFSVWTFPPVTAADLVDAHSANVDDSCSYGTCCGSQ